VHALMTMVRTRTLPAVSGFVMAALLCAGAARGGQPPAVPAHAGQAPNLAALKYRFVGPRVGNRIAAVAGIAGDPTVYYAGAASGGIWKSVDGGNRWNPIFDKQHVAAIGALAVAPSDPAIVWAGTGEAWVIRDSDVMGDGIYKSTDAGKTWNHMGLPESGRIGRIIVHPTNADLVYACVLGRTTGPQPERGVYRTLDGGHHWERVLFAGANVGCSGLSMDAHDPRTLFAGMWEVSMRTWGEFGGGPGSGLYVSHDGGTSWSRLADPGLPHEPMGKIDVAVAPKDSSRVYALIQTATEGSVWRSDDAGEHWRAVNHQRALIGRAGYYIRLAVSPVDSNEVLVANSSFHQSLDGADNFQETHWGGDTHDIWIDPTNADRFVITDDAGLIITTVHGRGFHRVTLPIGQMYHVAVDHQVPYDFYSNMQDDGNMRGPSVGWDGDEVGWDRHMGGCESGFTVPDPVDPNIVWATCYGDTVTRWDARNREIHSVSPWKHTLDSPPGDLEYRCHWTPPLAIDPFDHETVYYGCQKIFKTSNRGSSWSVVSPDLSTGDPAHLGSSGGIVGDNLGQFYGEVVFAIAPSPVQKGLIWAGTNDGQIWYTKDGAATWTNVTKNLPGLPPWGTITSIAPSAFDAAVAYVSVDFHLVDDRDPFVYKTADGGRTWKRIDAGLPRHSLAYVRSVTEDPNCAGLLFVGTGNGVYYSPDDGAQWTALQSDLPPAPATWVVVQKEFHDLVVSTYGRGLYILDDISPLEQMSRAGAVAPVTLFEPRPAYRFSRSTEAIINFSAKAASKEPATLDILGADGTPIRRLESAVSAGINRLKWDLRYDSPRMVALRTAAPANPHVWNEPRFRDQDSRPVTHWGIKPAEVGPIVAPGAYRLRLTVDGKVYEQPLTVLADPHAPGSQADIEMSVRTLLRIRSDINRCADTVNEIEWMRKQLETLTAMLRPPHKDVAPQPVAEEGEDSEADPAPAPPRPQTPAQQQRRSQLLEATEALDQKLKGVEAGLVSPALTNSDDKYFVESDKLYLDLLWLNAEVGTGGGDVAGSADFAPTDTQLRLLDGYESALSTVETQYRQLLESDLPGFNRSLEGGRMAPIVPGT
jgi:photosystem II stability/assembly factor-like uncharacterized protein